MIAGLALSAVGTAASVAGSYEQAKAQDNAMNYQAQLNNEKAAQATTQGNIDYQATQQKTAQLIASQTAGYAGGGVVVNQDTPLQVNAQTAGYGTLDSQVLKNNDLNAAWGYSTQANVDEVSKINPVNSAITAGVGGVAGIGGSLLNYGLQQQNTYLSTPTSGTTPAGATGLSGGFNYSY